MLVILEKAAQKAGRTAALLCYANEGLTGTAAFHQSLYARTRDEGSCYYLARTLYTPDRWEEARAPFEQALRPAARQIIRLRVVVVGEDGDNSHHGFDLMMFPGGTVSEDEADAGLWGDVVQQNRRPGTMPPFMCVMGAGNRDHAIVFQ